MSTRTLTVLLAACTITPCLLFAQSAGALEPLGIALESYRYPYSVQFLSLKMEGQDVRMAYMDARPTGQPNGKTIVLFHGKNFGGYYWKDFAGSLTQAGYRVIMPDQVGWGKSSKPAVRYNFHTLAANTARLLDTLGIPQAAILGHSTGGMLAARFALSYPERVTHLILEDPIGLEDYRAKVPPQTDDKLYEAELANTDPEKIRAFYARYFAQPKPEIYGPLADVQIRLTMSGEYPRWAKASALAYQMIYEQPVKYEYKLLKPPVLLVVGDQDHAAPLSAYAPPEVRKTMGQYVPMGREAIKEIPRGKLEIIAQCGHIPHLERPEQFLPLVLQFLQHGIQ